MRALTLISKGLEEAVADLLGGLEAKASPGPVREHDLEVTFPEPFVRMVGTRSVNIRVNKKFVVEVKSSQRKGAKLEDLRQTYDWVLRESRRLVPPETQAALLSTVEDALGDLEFRLEGEAFERSAAENADARSAMKDLVRAVELLLNGTSFRVKGLFIINHNVQNSASSVRPMVESNILEFAKINQIAIMSWAQLLNIAAMVKAGEVDPLNFWSCLFETNGLFELGDYQWRERVRFQESLFDPREVGVLSDIKFLKREPEAVLANPWW
jgi:hypothetical protein